MYIKKEGFTSKKEGFIQLWKKEGNVHKKRRFYSVPKKKEGWKKKEGKKKEMYPPKFCPVLIGQTIYSRVHMSLSSWVESIGGIKKFHYRNSGALPNAPEFL